MSDHVLTDRIRAEVLGMGMDLVGFAPVSRWEHAPYLLSPQAILPDSRSVVVAAIHITDTWTEMGGEPEPQDRSPGGWMDQNSLLDRVAYRTVRLLGNHGQKAIAVASSNIWRYRSFEGIPSLFAPDLSHIHAAAAAGLAEIGWNGLAITPEFGSRCRFISVVTSADLVPSPMYDGPKLCDMCGACIKHCPTAALRKELGKPHEVNIGGRVFRYANKNMWRCAWAEHFNLDLNSATLKQLATVGEKQILDEIAAKGTRGHERGVCQKVCVPPHLRTQTPSFGRPDKQIAQNRINRRYPDGMPTLRKLRDDLLAYAARFGSDLASVGPLDPGVEAGRLALKDAPGMRTVLAFAIRVPPEANDRERYGGDVGAPFWYGYERQMHHLLLRAARYVEDCGYHAASYTGGLAPVANDADRLAAMARLGTLNSAGRLETPEFGPHAIVGAVVTDAPLDATPPSERQDAPSKLAALSPKQLRAELEHLANQNLVSLFGVAPTGRFDNLVADLKANVNEAELAEDVVDENPRYHGPWVSRIERRADKHLRHPRDLVPDAKSVIVLGMHFPGELIANAGLAESQQIGTYAFHQYQTAHELRFAACALAKALSERGHGVVVTENLLGVGSQVDTHRGRLPDARCGALEAVAAGLGEIGRNGSLLTPEYDAHQRQIVLVTDAELPTDAVYRGPALCRGCGECRRACPMQALPDRLFNVRVDGLVARYPALDRQRCDWSKKYALCKEEGPALIGNKTDVPTPAGQITIDRIAEAAGRRDPIMKRRPCILENCLRQCQAGRLRKS